MEVQLGHQIVMIKMEDIEYWKVEEEAWRDINPILYKQARNKIMELGRKKESKLVFNDYKKKTVKELKDIAKGLNIPKYYDLNEDDLIRGIMKRT